jgi:hypothetical protein
MRSAAGDWVPRPDRPPPRLRRRLGLGVLGVIGDSVSPASPQRRSRNTWARGGAAAAAARPGLGLLGSTHRSRRPHRAGWASAVSAVPIVVGHRRPRGGSPSCPPSHTRMVIESTSDPTLPEVPRARKHSFPAEMPFPCGRLLSGPGPTAVLHHLAVHERQRRGRATTWAPISGHPLAAPSDHSARSGRRRNHERPATWPPLVGHPDHRGLPDAGELQQEALDRPDRR